MTHGFVTVVLTSGIRRVFCGRLLQDISPVTAHGVVLLGLGPSILLVYLPDLDDVTQSHYMPYCKTDSAICRAFQPGVLHTSTSSALAIGLGAGCCIMHLSAAPVLASIPDPLLEFSAHLRTERCPESPPKRAVQQLHVCPAEGIQALTKELFRSLNHIYHSYGGSLGFPRAIFFPKVYDGGNGPLHVVIVARLHRNVEKLYLGITGERQSLARVCLRPS